MLCNGKVQTNFTHIIQDYFTATGQSYDCPSASEVTLKDIGDIQLICYKW